MTIMQLLIDGLSIELYPMIPKFFGIQIIDQQGLKKLLLENEEKILRWLQKNKNLINQL